MSDLTHEALVEKAARVMCQSLGDDWEREGGESLTAYVDAARAVIATIAKALKEPTEAMIRAGAKARHSSACDGGYTVVGRLAAEASTREALAKSPLYPEGK